ncbi:MAG: D-alanyl-D-alanine carboxypeptidase/D-alanyl-D-alanine-endopeptidase [Actinomycetes bacterium]
MVRHRRYRLPLIVVVVAVLLSGALLGSAHLVRTRTDTRPAGTMPTAAFPASAVLALDRRAPAPSAVALRTALAPFVRAPALGHSLVGAVVDVSGRRTAYALNAEAAVPPASTTKLVTAAAALRFLRADDAFRTRVAIGTTPRTSSTVVLIGGGDPTLAGPNAALPAYPPVAHLTDLVRRTAAALRGRRVSAVRLVVDDYLFTGPRTAPGWKPTYLTDGDVSPVTALSVDAGRLRPDNNPKTPDDRALDPALTAGRDFAALLTRQHIRVTAAVRRAHLSTPTASLASVSSPPLTALITRMLQNSDNDIAESLFRHIAIARHQPATFTGGSIAVQQYLLGLPVDTRADELVDGSGLSLRDRLSPHALTTVLAGAAGRSNPALRPMVAALPVAGVSGTLSSRYRQPPRKVLPTTGAGLVRAKTGTLTGVSALAGVVVDTDGRLLAFAFVADAVPLGGLTAAERALDAIAARLSTCGCG